MRRLRGAAALRRIVFTVCVTASALCFTPALACPRCLGASSRSSLLAYFATGAVLSALPLGIIGVVAFVVYRHRMKRVSADPAEK